jgi:hypothetical protein
MNCFMGSEFLSDPCVMLANEITPFGIPAVLIEGNEVEIFQRARVEIGVHRFFDVFVSPLSFDAFQQITNDPSLWRFNLLIVLRECPFPDRPQNATEYAATVALGDARQLDDVAILFRAFPAFDLFSDQFFSSDT